MMFNPLDFVKDHIVDVAHGVAVQIGSSIFHFIAEEAFALATGTSLVCLLLIMFGSTRAKKWLYWTVAGYIIVEIGKAVLIV